MRIRLSAPWLSLTARVSFQFHFSLETFNVGVIPMGRIDLSVKFFCKLEFYCFGDYLCHRSTKTG